MSYDLIVWRGVPEGAEGLAWSRLGAGDPVPGLEPFAADEVRAAFLAACRGDVELEGDAIAGIGFTVFAEDGAPYLHVTCDWAFAGDLAAQAPIRDAAHRLGATVFDPQTAEPPPIVAQPIVVAAETEWGTHRVHEATAASTLAGLITSTVPGDRGPLLDQVHELFLHQASDGVTRDHEFHPATLRDLACSYARLAPGALPFGVVVAAGRGVAADGTGVGLPNRVLGIADDQLAMLGSPIATLATAPDGSTVSRWTAIALHPGGPRHDARGVSLDLSDRLAAAARAALAQAHAGDTLPLRRLIVALVSVDAMGRAAFEHGALALTGDAGAALPVWVQRSFAPRLVEARLRVPDDGGFELTLVALADADAESRALPPPVGGD